MAKVLIKNSRTQDLTLHVGDQRVTVKAGVQGPEGFAPGTEFVEEKFVEEARKHPVVKAWFSEGYLTLDRKATE